MKGEWEVPKIDIAAAPEGSGSRYPAPHNAPCLGRQWKKLGDAVGLSQYGVNLLTLRPGVWSSQRHWHSHEDEFAYVLTGEVVLVEDDGETTLKPGDCAGWAMNVENGHCLQNRSSEDATLLIVGGRSADDSGQYPDIDMKFSRDGTPGGGLFVHKDGTPY